jgi:hypothetical protein
LRTKEFDTSACKETKGGWRKLCNEGLYNLSFRPSAKLEIFTEK